MSTLLDNRFHVFEGTLYRDDKPLREKFEWHFREIDHARQVAACLRAGPNAWPGFYPMFFIATDGEAICFKCARGKWRTIARSMIGKYRDDWTIVACSANWEDQDCFCAHCNERIEPAYE